MKLVNSAVSLYFKSRYHRIEKMVNEPIQTQEQIFKYLIESAKNTEWGVKHDYKSINKELTFRERVPVGDYESHKSYINKMMHGMPNILWQGQVKWFSKSSGTTSDKSKYLPVSDAALKQTHMRGPRDTLTMYHINYPNPNLFDGDSIVLSGSLAKFKPFPKTQFGDVSAIMVSNMPSFFRLFYTPSHDVALLTEWEKKLDLAAKQAIKKNITSMGGVPTWNLVLFRKVLELSGKSNILEVWPNFELYIHGGVNFEPYRAQFRELLPSDDVNYQEVYNASEGYFAAQMHPEDDDMFMLLDNGIYYEFVPMDDWAEGNMENTVPLSGVKMGVNYAILISTNAGLWRYQCGDTVKFTSLSPYKIKITGRTKHFINAFGEEVMVANTDKAIAMTCETMNCTVEEYTAAPVYISGLEGRGGHEWIIEFGIAPNDIEEFAELLDKNLQSINSDYEAKRFRSLALNRLKINAVNRNTFLDWMRSRGKFGGQNKVPRLSNNRRYVEEILEFAKRK
jgi:hypothetical protein